MKKILFFLMIVTLILALVSSCNESDAGNGNGNENGENGTGNEGEEGAGSEGGEGVGDGDGTESEVPGDVDIYEIFRMDSVVYEDSSLPYRIYVPEDYDETKSYPFLLFLHGGGERGDDNTLQLKNVIGLLFEDEDSPVHDAIVVCPQCPTGKQWVDTVHKNGSYDLSAMPMSDSMKGVMALIEKLEGEYSLDADRYYVMGISMGGFGTWDLCMRYYDMFAAAAPICGGADPEEMVLLASLPIYTAHGTADKSVPVRGTQEAVAALREAGSEVIYYDELEGYPHNVWDYAVTEATVNGVSMIEWLFSQSLSDR